MSFTKILCPVDFSAAAPVGIRPAISLASHYDADLALLHVINYPSPQMETVVPVGDIKHLAARMCREAQTFLEGLAGEEIPPEIRTECLAETGVPYQRIVDVAEELGADLIVMPTRSLTRVDRWFLGSTVERVVRLASCPVLTVPPFNGEPSDFLPSKVVLATDFSDFSDRALPYALSVSEKYAADLLMVHVATVSAFDPADPAWRFLEIPLDHIEAVEKAAVRELDSRAEEARGSKVNVQTRMVRGFDPAAEIVDVAEEEDADLVVMATHGHTGLLPALLGSTAEQMVRHSTRPVLTIHPARV